MAEVWLGFACELYEPGTLTSSDGECNFVSSRAGFTERKSSLLDHWLRGWQRASLSWVAEPRPSNPRAAHSGCEIFAAYGAPRARQSDFNLAPSC